MKYKIFLVIIAVTFVITNSCSDNSTQPPVINYKHPRDMTWTADTLEMPDYAIQLLPQDLLVVTPNDIWLTLWVGHGEVMHFDSATGWQVVKEVGGGIGCIVEGERQNKVWVGGYIGREVDGQFAPNAYIGYYNSINWQDTEFNIRGEILDITKDASGNIWACGRNGLVMKYENNIWIADTINVGYKQTHPDAEFLLRSIISYNNQVHILGGLYHPELQLYINYHFKGYMNNWELLDSMIIDSPSSIIKWGDLGLYETTNNFYSYGTLGIWEYQNSNWTKINDFNGEIYEMYGQSNKYLLAVSAYRTVLFYNGNTWERIDELLNVDDPHFSFRNVWTNGYEIIIAGDGNIDGIQKTLVWHGK